METNTLTLEQLKSLLTSNPSKISPEIEEHRRFIAFLKQKLTHMYEELYKLDLFNEDFSLKAFIDVCVDTPLFRHIEQLEKPWLSDKLTVGLMGHYSTGKTSVLNCLFKTSLPTDGTESTSLPTYMINGNSKQCRIVDKDNNVQLIESSQVQLIDYQYSNNFPFARIFKYLVMEKETPLLKDLTFIDTPGLFSDIQDHGNPTDNIAKECDVIFWFLKASSGFDGGTIGNTEESLTSVEYIKKHNLSEKPFYLVITFADARGVSLEQALPPILKTAEENNIKVDGYLTFGKRAETQEKFLANFSDQMQALIENNEKYHPIVEIIGLVSQTIELINEYQLSFQEQINEVTNKENIIENTFLTSTKTYITAQNQVFSRFNNMINTFNTRCSGAMFCGGAETAMVSDLTHTGEQLDKMSNAFSNIDHSTLTEYGNWTVIRHELQEKFDKLEELKNDCLEIKNYFE